MNSNPFGRQVIPHLAPPLTALFALGGNGVLFSLTALFGTMTVESDQPVAAVALRQNEDILDTFPSSVPTLTVFPVIAGRADQASN